MENCGTLHFDGENLYIQRLACRAISAFAALLADYGFRLSVRVEAARESVYVCVWV